jgi:sterol 14-demethylase
MHKTYAFLGAMFGQVAFTASPETYREQRHILHAPFKAQKMVSYIAIMQEEVQAWLDSLDAEGEIELTDQINVLVQNVAAHALMGKDFRQKMGREFWDLYIELNKGLDPLLPPNLPLPKFRRRDQARAQMLAILRPIVEERRAHPDQYDDFLQEFVTARYKDGREVEDETIMNLILGLMFAGHETTAGQAAWTVVELARNPDYLALVQQELAEKLPQGTGINQDVLNSLQYLEWAVREVSRLHPSADMLIRLAEEDVDVGQYVIPQGWPVFVSAAEAHRIETLFAAPDRFDPLRFAPDREEDRQHRFAMIPFGGGVHKCTGMNFANNEMMVINALLFQQFAVELVTKDPPVFYGMGAARPDKTVIRYQRQA